MTAKPLPETIDVERLQIGQLIVGFVDVPDSFSKLSEKAVNFLRKYEFKRMEVMRNESRLILNAEELDANDKILTMGNMIRFIRLKNETQCETLKQMNFKRVRVISLEDLGAYAKTARKNGGSTVARKTSRTVKLKNEVRSSIHKLQDTIRVSERVASEAESVISDLFEKGHHQHFDVKQIQGLSSQINEMVNQDQNAMSALSFLQQHDDYTFRHCVDVANQMLVALKYLNRLHPTYTEEQMKDIGMGALLHDIGKSCVPKELINKPGRLTDSEWVYMRTHPSYSAKMMTNFGLSKINVEIGLYHHVHKDGSGYPKANFDTIPIAARMCTISDVFQALTTRRPYRKTDSPFLALKKIKVWAQDQFDERLAHIFIKAFGVYPPGTLVHLNDGRTAFVMMNAEDSLRPVVAAVFDENRQKVEKAEVLNLADPELFSLQITGTADTDSMFSDGKAVDVFQSIDF